MNSSTMRIKRELPKTDQRLVTKTVHDNRFLGEGINTYIHKPSPSPMDDFGQSENTKENASRHKKQEMERRHKIMKTLLEAGATDAEIAAATGYSNGTDAEIAAATGYSNGTVRKILTQWRRAGVELPDRRKGRKKNEKEGKEESH